MNEDSKSKKPEETESTSFDTYKHKAEELIKSIKPKVFQKIDAIFLFADLGGSTQLMFQKNQVVGYRKITEHNQVVRDYVVTYKGVVIKELGDGVLAKFEGPNSTINAVNAAIEIQRFFDVYNLSQPDIAYQIVTKIGIAHGAYIDYGQGDVVGTGINMAFRLAAAAEGGQILINKVLKDLHTLRPEILEES